LQGLIVFCFSENYYKKIKLLVGNIRTYPIRYDLALNDGVIYLSKGSDDGISVGEEFKVLGYGKEIKIGTKVIIEKNNDIIRVNTVFPDYATTSYNVVMNISEGDK